MTDDQQLRKRPKISAMTDDDHEHVLFDPDDLPLDFAYEVQLWHSIVATLGVVPYSFALLCLFPVIVCFCLATGLWRINA
jgi:hypothetical protein